MRFVQKTGVWNVQTGGRSDTPVLELPNITQKNTLRISVTFLAKTAGQANSGFSYTVQPTSSDAVALSNQHSTVQGNAGFQTTTLTAFFEARISSQTGVEELDFEVVFQAGDLDGAGEISNFLLTGEVVPLDP